LQPGTAGLTFSLSDSRRTTGFYITEAWQRFARRLALGRISAVRFAGTVPNRLIVAPIDLRVADPHIATEIYYGRFPFGGTFLDTEGASPFQMPAPSPGFFEELHGFGWLRHMRAANHDLAAANARSLVDDWITAYGRQLNSEAFRPNILSTRLIAWFSHSPVVLRGADHGFYRRFLKSIALQVRYLRHVAPAVPLGETRFRVRIALAMASLCLPASHNAIRTAARHLDDEFARQILPDGGHISRNGQVLLNLLTDLLPLRQTYVNVGSRLPPRMTPGIDRIFTALKFFRHSNGELSLFNGATTVSADTLMSVLRYDDSTGLPFREAPHSRFQRLAAGPTVVIADTGPPPSGAMSRTAFAGCASFELSSGGARFIVNAGGPFHANEMQRGFARMTAAHSTVTLNDTSSLRYSQSGFLGPVVIGGVSRVDLDNLDQADGATGFAVTHDGYAAPFDKLHWRELRLAPDGATLSGRDRILRAGGRVIADDDHDEAVARFHVHPTITIEQSDDGAVLLTAGDGESWTFRCEELRPVIEDDVHFADLAGPRACRQIAVAFTPREIPEIRWRFSRVSGRD